MQLLGLNDLQAGIHLLDPVDTPRLYRASFLVLYYGTTYFYVPTPNVTSHIHSLGNSPKQPWMVGGEVTFK